MAPPRRPRANDESVCGRAHKPLSTLEGSFVKPKARRVCSRLECGADVVEIFKSCNARDLYLAK